MKAHLSLALVCPEFIVSQGGLDKAIRLLIRSRGRGCPESRRFPKRKPGHSGAGQGGGIGLSECLASAGFNHIIGNF